jgi:hypothetical protein
MLSQPSDTENVLIGFHPAVKGVEHNNPFAALPGPLLRSRNKTRVNDQNEPGVRFLVLQTELENASAGVVLDLAECVLLECVFNFLQPWFDYCVYGGMCRAHWAEDVPGGVRSARGPWRDQEVAQQHLDHVARVNRRWPAQGVDAGHVSRAGSGETPHSRRPMVRQLTGSNAA